MENEVFLYVSVISGVFSIVCIQLLNQNWFKRQELKSQLRLRELGYKYKIDKRKLRLKEKITVPDYDTPLEGGLGGLNKYAKWLPILKSLDQDQIGEILNILGGNMASQEYDDESPISQILDNLPPDLITSFLEGLNKNKSEQPKGY